MLFRLGLSGLTQNIEIVVVAMFVVIVVWSYNIVVCGDVFVALLLLHFRLIPFDCGVLLLYLNSFEFRQ